MHRRNRVKSRNAEKENPPKRDTIPSGFASPPNRTPYLETGQDFSPKNGKAKNNPKKLEIEKRTVQNKFSLVFGEC